MFLVPGVASPPKFQRLVPPSLSPGFNERVYHLMVIRSRPRNTTHKQITPVHAAADAPNLIFFLSM